MGKSWSVSKPCYVHFNLIPPTKVDPINVSTFIEPITMTIPPTFTGDDEVYVWASAPTFTPTVTSSKVMASARTSAAVTCNCPVSSDTRVPRIFPANSVPIGFALIRGGKFAPIADDILGRQQVFVGPGAEMALRIDQGGYWFEVAPASQAAATQMAAAKALQVESARTEATIRMLAEMKPADEEIQEAKNLAKQALETSQNALYGRQNIDSQIEHLSMQAMEQVNQVRFGLEQDLEMKANQIRMIQLETNGFGLPENRVEVPAKAGECQMPHWALDSKYVYRCVATKDATGKEKSVWVRLQYSQKW